jgi:hypothetical protein
MMICSWDSDSKEIKSNFIKLYLKAQMFLEMREKTDNKEKQKWITTMIKTYSRIAGKGNRKLSN